MENLKGKKIILGITGSIAAYKAAIITRLMIKAGAEVQVIMTPAGKEFITPVTLSTLTGKPVISEFFTANDGTWHSHVDLGLWADAMLIAPATAATIGKMANGIADNMLVTTYLSSKTPVFVAPAMDLDMLKHPTTQRNIHLLRTYGNTIIEPTEGELASHLHGKGRMEEPDKIVEILDTYFGKQKDLSKKKILITAGPTYEKIDPVRFIGNYSSGKMGFALAEACAERGAEVTLVTGPVALSCTSNIRRIDVESASEMYREALDRFPEMDAAILCAAVADYRPETYSDKKIKREKTGNISLTLVQNKDIASALGQIKQSHQCLVGFALESHEEEAHAIDKMQRKNLDFIVLNSLKDKGAGFKVDTNKITILAKNGTKIKYELKSKKEVATDILNYMFEHMLKNE